MLGFLSLVNPVQRNNNIIVEPLPVPPPPVDPQASLVIDFVNDQYFVS